MDEPVVEGSLCFLTAGMSELERRGDTGSAAVSAGSAGSLELEYKDWLCWRPGCVGKDYDPVRASGEAVESLLWVELGDARWGLGKLC